MPDAIELVQAKHVALRADGQADAAIAFVLAKAKEFPKGPYRRELVTIYRELRLYDQAVALLTELNKESPEDINLAASLIQTISFQAADAGARNETDRERSLNEKAALMIKDYRSRYRRQSRLASNRMRPGRPSRRLHAGHRAHARNGQDIPRPRRSAACCEPDSTRCSADRTKSTRPTPKRSSATRASSTSASFSGRRSSGSNEPDEALRQASFVLDVEKDRPDAVLLQAQALAEAGSTETERAKSQELAIARLKAAIQANPQFVDAFHTLAEIHLKRKDRAAAATVLKEDLKANPKTPPRPRS